MGVRVGIYTLATTSHVALEPPSETASPFYQTDSNLYLKVFCYLLLVFIIRKFVFHQAEDMSSRRI